MGEAWAHHRSQEGKVQNADGYTLCSRRRTEGAGMLFVVAVDVGWYLSPL